MNKINFSDFRFARIMDLPDDLYVLDLTESYNPEFISQKEWAVGRYNEKRTTMYSAPQYKGERNIHMGIDFWAPAGEPVYAFDRGEIAYLGDNTREGDYGPTLVTRHHLNGSQLFALYGHLGRRSITGLRSGQPVRRGEKLAEVGTAEENGGWIPHLHFQISVEDPGKADMPGVVADENHREALAKYPDPQLIVGKVY